MFKKIFIENHIKDSPYTQNILKSFPAKGTHFIDDYSEIWGRVKKPYLQKRDNLNLFIASKKGEIVKIAPDAYGLGQEKHFYFIHAYNCIYECQYCYLQGYFHTPDIVLFVNHQEICDAIENKIKEFPDAWFHAGEFSDSLALSHITKELTPYFNLFKKYPKAKLELRTKSVNTKFLESLPAQDNIIISFSLSTQKNSKEFDLKTPSLKARIEKMKHLADIGFKLGIHLDPIIYSNNLKEEYQDLIQKLSILSNQSIEYISIGVVRYTQDVFYQVKSNYPDSKLVYSPYIRSFDGKLRYSKPLRSWIFNSVESELYKYFDSKKVYRCME